MHRTPNHGKLVLYVIQATIAHTTLIFLSKINTKPDVFIASEEHFSAIKEHYEREFRIYSLMKWILRVYRRDPHRTTPLLMVDTGQSVD